MYFKSTLDEHFFISNIITYSHPLKTMCAAAARRNLLRHMSPISNTFFIHIFHRRGARGLTTQALFSSRLELSLYTYRTARTPQTHRRRRRIHYD